MALDIERLLNELAGQARRYDNPTAVLHAARRLRRRRRLASAGAAVVTAALALTTALVVTAAPGGGDDAARPSPNAPDPAAIATSLHLPRHIDPPDGPAPTLPADHAVGRSALVYRMGDTTPAYLVTASGKHYEVPVPSLAGTAFNDTYRRLPMSISPDGRWLFLISREGSTVRDLTGTAVRALEPMAIVEAWSPDGRWLLYGHGLRETMLDLESGESWTLPHEPSFDLSLAAVDGWHLTATFDSRLLLRWYDVRNGVTGDAVQVDAGSLIADAELLSGTLRTFAGANCGHMWVSGLHDGRLLVGIEERRRPYSCSELPEPQIPTNYLVVSAADGRATGRVRVPAHALVTWPQWFNGAIAYRPAAPASGRIELALVSASGEDLGTLTSLPAQATYVLAGALGPPLP